MLLTMTITKLLIKGKYTYICISDGSVIRVPRLSVSELDIYEGYELELDEITTLRLKAYEQFACKEATKMLKRGFLSQKQLWNKLYKKGHKKRFIRYAIRYCKEYDLINDKRFASIAVSSLLLKGKSKRYIERYLVLAGIKRSIIEKALRIITNKKENILLKDAIRKYYPIYKHKKDVLNLLIKSLMRKGFDYNRSKKLITLYIKNIKRKQRKNR